MSVDIKDRTTSMLQSGTLSLAVTGNTTAYTVPAGFNMIPFGIGIKAGADAGDSVVTAGLSTDLDDFLGEQTLSNLDAEDDYVLLMPIPAATPVKQKVYAAGEIVQIAVTTADGGATNTYYFFGTLEAE